jgi:hypothetical protein
LPDGSVWESPKGGRENLLGRLLSLALIFVVLAMVCTGTDKALGDGCFVLPFSWNKSKDINEPTQKAIIVYDGGHEDFDLAGQV